MPTDPRAHARWIRAQLLLRGWTLADIARRHGVDITAPRQALRKPYPKMERAIADVLGVHPAELWPWRYDAAGRPNRPMGRPRQKSITGVRRREIPSGRKNRGRMP